VTIRRQKASSSWLWLTKTRMACGMSGMAGVLLSREAGGGRSPNAPTDVAALRGDGERGVGDRCAIALRG
jgi:hypothetical protein